MCGLRFRMFFRYIARCFQTCHSILQSIVKLIFIFGILLPIAQAETLSFINLNANETIKIESKSQGCFHNNTNSYQVRGGKVKMFDMIKKESENTIRNLGTISLSDTDLEGLDILIDLYRQVSTNTCTTHIYLDIVYERDNLIIGKESLVDSSCKLATLSLFKNHPELLEARGGIENLPDIKNLVSLDDLAQRITPNIEQD